MSHATKPIFLTLAELLILLGGFFVAGWIAHVALRSLL